MKEVVLTRLGACQPVPNRLVQAASSRQRDTFSVIDNIRTEPILKSFLEAHRDFTITSGIRILTRHMSVFTPCSFIRAGKMLSLSEVHCVQLLRMISLFGVLVQTMVFQVLDDVDMSSAIEKAGWRGGDP